MRSQQIPPTEINHKHEEYCKATKGIRTALGEALLAWHHGWIVRGNALAHRLAHDEALEFCLSSAYERFV
jgi:hypothetical protein